MHDWPGPCGFRSKGHTARSRPQWLQAEGVLLSPSPKGARVPRRRCPGQEPVPPPTGALTPTGDNCVHGIAQPYRPWQMPSQDPANHCLQEWEVFSWRVFALKGSSVWM